MKVLVTGAGGFVGQPLCAQLERAGHEVRRALHRPAPDPEPDSVVVGEVGANTDWTGALLGVEAVVHLAARVHILRDDASDPLAEYNRVNVEGTRGLALAAVRAGVRRFVFLSSAKVHGERSVRPFRELDLTRPEDAYAVSKLEAEAALQTACAGSAVQWSILRPPLVYGAGVRANFLRLLRSVAHGVPLPLASIRNRRSLIYLGNLVHAAQACLERPRAAGRTFLVSDGEDLSTPELVRRVARALDTPVRLFPAPVWLLRGVGAIARRSATVERLVDSLQLDIGAIRSALEWQPPFAVDDGLAETARWYRRVEQP
jgi:nucleoside-diphosphate-sugar epimerase